jgi:putative membrane protein
MINYNPKDWFEAIFLFHKSDTFNQLKYVLIGFALFSTVIVFLSLHYDHIFNFKSTTAIHSLLGFVFGLLLVFRTNTAYDRWWEGRKQWGAMVNDCRNLAMKLNTLLPKEEHSLREYYKHMIPNYVFAMKEHLREGVIWSEINTDAIENVEEIKSKEHVPNAFAQQMYWKLQDQFNKGNLTGEQMLMLDKELKGLTDTLGACERIRKTPIPYSYSLFLKKFIFAYTITMPFGMASDFKYWTVPIVTFILYVFSSIELLAEEIENPFGDDTNDLPTDDIAVTIKNNVHEIFETSRPN